MKVKQNSHPCSQTRAWFGRRFRIFLNGFRFGEHRGRPRLRMIISRQSVRSPVRSRSPKMFSVLVFWCICFVLVGGDLRQMSLPVYTPPSQEEMLNTYFQPPEQSDANRTKKSILSGSDNFQKTVEAMKKDLSENISILQKNMTEGNLTEPLQIRTGVVKNFLTGPIEPTTYRYPTAIWSSQTYEKLKNTQKFRPRNATRIYIVRPTLNPAYVYLDRGFKTPRRNRGKTKWKDVKSAELENPEFADRFLEQSLDKYLTSSNLRENVGNVSVKTFSDILRNITEQKPKRLQSPYDENKELRMKFREEVILKKKNNNNETKPQQGGFLEKQLQRRLEKVQDMFNEKDKDKILANMWKYSTLNRTIEAPEERRNKMATEEAANVTVEPFTTAPLLNASLIYVTTEHPMRYSTNHIRGTAKYHRPKYETTEKSRYYYEGVDDGRDGGSHGNLLTAQETTYYRRGQFPSLTFIGQAEKPGVIPGRPLIDYPVHNFPPPTKFKCPKFKEGKPRMMADPETRCQVFYICTGDGPTTAMLCPNGTMFNEKFLVCDWWYNVNC